MPPDRKSLTLGPISPAETGALYQQIVDGFKREISEGRLAPGDALPSFRALAEELLVSVITVKRAYEELERDGIIYRRQGLGTFVAEKGGLRSRQAQLGAARSLFDAAVREAAQAGLTREQILDLARSAIEKAEKHG